MKSMLKLLPHLIVTEILSPEYIVWDDGRRYRIDKFPMCGMRRLSSRRCGNTLHLPYPRQRTISVFGGKQVVCRCQTISGGLYA